MEMPTGAQAHRHMPFGKGFQGFLPKQTSGGGKKGLEGESGLVWFGLVWYGLVWLVLGLDWGF